LEVELLDAARKLKPHYRNMLHVLATEPEHLRALGSYVDRFKAADADTAQLVELVAKMDDAARAIVMDVARLAAASSR
jgi:uncharacterized protein YbgA (DUF1722 family)